MMSGYGANPIFFNKRNKDWKSRTLANPHPLRSITTTSHFCLTPFAFTHLELTEKEDDEEEMEASAPIVDDELTSKLLRQDTAYVVIDDD